MKALVRLAAGVHFAVAVAGIVYTIYAAGAPDKNVIGGVTLLFGSMNFVASLIAMGLQQNRSGDVTIYLSLTVAGFSLAMLGLAAFLAVRDIGGLMVPIAAMLTFFGVMWLLSGAKPSEPPQTV